MKAQNAMMAVGARHAKDDSNDILDLGIIHVYTSIPSPDIMLI